ncbi:MAG: hypothetical protein ACREJC_12470 [Tepidisphaeraceae bacterium]
MNRLVSDRNALKTLLLGATLILSGCQAAGLIADKVAGGRLPAAYTPQKVPTLVLVEKYQNPAQFALDSEPLATYVTDELQRHDVVPTIDPSRVESLRRASGQAYRNMAIAKIGRELGASQIIYVDIIDISVDTTVGGEMIKGKADALVRVVDTQSGRTLWPADSAGGMPVSFGVPLAHVSPSNAEWTVRDNVLRGLAGNIGRLFYTTSKEEAAAGL